LDGTLTSLRGALKLAAAGLRRPWRATALLAMLVRTGSTQVILSTSPTGHALLAYLNQRWLGVLPKHRLCRAVLLLPDDHSQYLRGRSRQALRTNLHRAAGAGIECEAIRDSALAVDAVFEILYSRRRPISEGQVDDALCREWAAQFARPDTTLLIARDQNHRRLAFLAAVIDETACLIKVAVASSHEARWALHDHLVRTLIADGITCVMVEGGGPFGSLGLSSQEQYYQHLLGYELRHVNPVVPVRLKLSHRLKAGLTRRRASTWPA
jgi:hypothetical protein